MALGFKSQHLGKGMVELSPQCQGTLPWETSNPKKLLTKLMLPKATERSKEVMMDSQGKIITTLMSARTIKERSKRGQQMKQPVTYNKKYVFGLCLFLGHSS